MTNIIVTGNPVDGFAFYGPFVVGEDAYDWAEREFNLGDWWIADLHEAEEQA